jgi:hypothetical protein
MNKELKGEFIAIISQRVFKEELSGHYGTTIMGQVLVTTGRA